MATATPEKAPEKAGPPAPPSVPGGMASDPAIAAASDIVSFIQGAQERHKGESVDDVKSQVMAEVVNKIRAAIAAATPSKGV